jgi:hypothetical protein
MPDNFDFGAPVAPLSIALLLMNLAVGAVLAIVLRAHFRKFGSTLSNREEFAQVFPFVLLTTILIITVVKSSLALSLGLVGALSIVRFRTPIKEPEELAYLFIAIAMGLGLGANQTLATVVAGLAILGVMALLGSAQRNLAGKRIYLSVDLRGEAAKDTESSLARITEIILGRVVNNDLRRYDIREDSLEAVYFLDIATADDLSALTDDLRSAYPSIGVTFLDQSQMPSI